MMKKLSRLNSESIKKIDLHIRSFLKGRYWPVVLIISVLLFTVMRMVKINADAPPELSISAALYTDEGFKTLSAKNKLYYGDWKWSPDDEYGSWHEQSPVPTYLFYQWFSWFGVSLASIRYLNVIFASLTMILLFFFVKKHYDIVTAFLALFMFGISHFTSMYQRMGFFENFLVFFSLIVCISVFYIYDSRAKLKTVLHNSAIRPSKEIFKLIFYVFVGCIATLCGIYTKQSVMLILVALIPFFYLYFLYSHHRLNKFVIKNFYIIVVCIVCGYFFTAHFDSFESIAYAILKFKVFDVELGFLLPFKRGSGNFDPLYLMFAKSLFIEFIFLQPVIFFSAMYFALYVFHNFLYRDKLRITDMVFASWFVFGFIFLSILKYHPSRYYLILTLPLVILSARFFKIHDKEDLAELVEQEKKLSLRRVIGALLKFYFLFNLGASLFMVMLPLKIKKYFYDDIYFKFSSHRFVESFPTIGIIAGWIILVFLITLPLMGHLYKALRNKLFYSSLFSLMLFLQLFQYGKWLFFSEYNHYELSKKIVSLLPENSVITGGWSAGLTIENKIRPIVFQGELNYNVELIDSIIAEKKMNVYADSIIPAQRAVITEENIPVYLAVSSNGQFDGKIREKYNEYLVKNRELITQQLGYFDLLIYSLNNE